MSHLLGTATAHNLVRVFPLQERLKGLCQGIESRPGRVHVVGGGVMGGDIAAWCALQGLRVTVQDLGPEPLGRALTRAQTLYARRLKDPRLVRAALDRLIPDTRGGGVASADVLVEAVYEDLEAKQAVNAAVERRLKPTAWIATNTFSIPLEQLAHKSGVARRLLQAAAAVGWRRFEHLQGRTGWSPELLLWPLLGPWVARKIMSRLGGRLRLAVCGGAPLPPEVARLLVGLGLPLLQGYGLTEASPVISVNRLRANVPDSVGRALPNVEVRIGESEELQVRAPSVMLGYWRRPAASAAIVDADGWLHTGIRLGWTPGMATSPAG